MQIKTNKPANNTQSILCAIVILRARVSDGSAALEARHGFQFAKRNGTEGIAIRISEECQQHEDGRPWLWLRNCSSRS